MKISKHLHSCLLVEEQDKTLLIDPGIFTYQEKTLDINNLQTLDYLLITHEHPDHLALPFVKEIVTKFPKVKIVTTQSIVEILEKENIKATSEEDTVVTLEKASHEQLWDNQPPENVSITIFGKLTSPGDSIHFEKTGEVLALPIVAPWGSTTDAIKLALKLKPKVIIPIHDWMYKDSVRQMMYQRLHEFFKKNGIDFKAVEMGDVVEV